MQVNHVSYQTDVEYIKKINLRTIFFSAVRQNVPFSLALFLSHEKAQTSLTLDFTLPFYSPL